MELPCSALKTDCHGPLSTKVVGNGYSFARLEAISPSNIFWASETFVARQDRTTPTEYSRMALVMYLIALLSSVQTLGTPSEKVAKHKAEVMSRLRHCVEHVVGETLETSSSAPRAP